MSKPEFYTYPGFGERARETLHHSQAVKIGDRVEISGQGGWDDDLNFPGDLAEEIAQAYRNVERALAAAGAEWRHVVHVNSYHVGGFPPEVNETMGRLNRHYMPDNPPVWTEIGVESLAHPAMRIEIRVTAILF